MVHLIGLLATLLCAGAAANEPGAVPVPIATQALPPGAIIQASDVRWMPLLPFGEAADTVADTWPDPVGWLVVERILGGEPVRAERLLDPDTPERFAPPGQRVLRIPLPPERDRKGERVDLQVALPDGSHCTLLADRFVLGHGRGPDDRPDSTWLLVTVDEALQVLSEPRPMALERPGSPPCSP